jgi:hypothetical protein
VLVRPGYRSDQPVKRAQFLVTIVDHLDAGLFLLDNEFTGRLPKTLPPGHVITRKTDPINVTPGTCVAHVELRGETVQEDFVPHTCTCPFDVHDAFGREMLPKREYVRYMGQRSIRDAARVPGSDAQP